MDMGFVGILFFIIILFLILFKASKTQSSPIVYDEMQKMIQGNAYKYSGITCTIVGIVFAFLLDTEYFPMDGSFAMLAVSILGVVIYAIYMIIKGAYFGVSGKWKRWMVLQLIIGVTNTVSGIIRIMEYGLNKGKLTINNASLLTGISFIIIATTVIIRKLTDKKDED